MVITRVTTHILVGLCVHQLSVDGSDLSLQLSLSGLQRHQSLLYHQLGCFQQWVLNKGGREGGRVGGREGGREGVMEGGREGGREGVMDAGREGGRE